MLYSCTHVATAGVKGLKDEVTSSQLGHRVAVARWHDGGSGWPGVPECGSSYLCWLVEIGRRPGQTRRCEEASTRWSWSGRRRMPRQCSGVDRRRTERSRTSRRYRLPSCPRTYRPRKTSHVELILCDPFQARSQTFLGGSIEAPRGGG